MTVAALFVDPGGVYAGLEGVEVWDEARDARLYAGPWPVVAHPPCARWCSLAFLNQHLHGYQIGDDAGCFAAALEAVRGFGGVLEHPAGSIAWQHFDLPRPTTRAGWTRSLYDVGWTCELEQSAYGHRARKRTWLYYVGAADPPQLEHFGPPATAKVSSFNHHPSGAFVPNEAQRVRPREASATPTRLRDVLLTLATVANGDNAATAGNNRT
jgi:hypothetical protein